MRIKVTTAAACLLAAFFSAVALIACAQQRTAASSAAMVIKTATVQRSIPGRREGRIFTAYRFVIVWKAKASPTNVFFRPDKTTWLDLHFSRNERRPMFAGSPDYMDMEMGVPNKMVRAGNQLMLSTDRHEDFPVPAEAQDMPAMCIYYQTADAPGRWKTIPVKNLRKLPDIQGI